MSKQVIEVTAQLSSSTMGESSHKAAAGTLQALAKVEGEEDETCSLHGEMLKKSPAGPIYQRRTFTVENGIMTYGSGKGSEKTINVADIVRVEASNPEQLEFSFTTKQGRVYHFRVESSEMFSYWFRGLQNVTGLAKQ